MIRSFRAHYARVSSLCWSPDGRTLASGSEDTTILIWPRSGLTSPLPQNLAQKALEECWKQLADPDPAVADSAIWRLHAAAASSVPFLQNALSPVKPADPQRLQRLLQNLDAEQYAGRQKAEAELEKLGDRTASVLRAFLAGKVSPEASRRAQRVLAATEAAVGSPEGLRIGRAVMILEQLGTPPARKLLAQWSRGAPDALLSREAKASLGRLNRKGR
jgi:hypothetical protein